MDAGSWEIVATDEVVVAVVDETAVTAIAVVAAEDSRWRGGNLRNAVGQNSLGWTVGLNLVSCGGSVGPERDNLEFLEEGHRSYMGP